MRLSLAVCGLTGIVQQSSTNPDQVNESTYDAVLDYFKNSKRAMRANKNESWN